MRCYNAVHTMRGALYACRKVSDLISMQMNDPFTYFGERATICSDCVYIQETVTPTIVPIAALGLEELPACTAFVAVAATDSIASTVCQHVQCTPLVSSGL